MYQKDSDPGLHASAEWLLRTWKDEGWLKQENEKWAKDEEWREKKVAGIKELVTKDKAAAAAVVCERSGTNDGCYPRLEAISDGIAAYRSGEE